MSHATNNITKNIHIHIPDIDKHGNFYITTKGGSMTQERLLNFINQVIIKHIDGTPAVLFLDAASINRSDAALELCNNITIVPIPLSSCVCQHNYQKLMYCYNFDWMVDRRTKSFMLRHCATRILCFAESGNFEQYQSIVWTVPWAKLI